MVHQSCSIVQSLVVKYHLAVSYLQYWNYNKSLMCHYNRNTLNAAFCIFSRRALNDFLRAIPHNCHMYEKQKY